MYDMRIYVMNIIKILIIIRIPLKGDILTLLVI